jgi:hypothetical protein
VRNLLISRSRAWPSGVARRRRTLDETVVLVIKTWTYAGTGYTSSADTQLAVAAAARTREHRRVAGEEMVAAS